MANNAVRDVPTKKTLKSTGGDVAMDLSSLAAGSAKMSAYGDAEYSTGKNYPYLSKRLKVKPNVAPSGGPPVEVYIAWSDTPTTAADFDGPNTLLTGSAGNWAPTSVAKSKLQLQFIGNWISDDTTDANWCWIATNIQVMKRYYVFVYVNSLGQALHATGTNHEGEVILHFDEIA